MLQRRAKIEVQSNGVRKEIGKKMEKKDQKNINFVPRQRRVGSRRKMTAKKIKME